MLHEQHTTTPKKRSVRKGKGFFGDLGNIAKNAALSVEQQGIDTGASYLNNKVNAMGGALKRHRVVGRKVAHKKNHLVVVVLVALYIQVAILLKLMINYFCLYFYRICHLNLMHEVIWILNIF